MAFYTLGIYAYGLLLHLASWFHPKARKWVQGRKNWAIQHRKLKAALPGSQPIFWFHCASLGEFEQGRPLIEALKKRDNPPLILLTFYSPSGYEIRKNYKGADVITYLPLDTPAQAREFINIWQPQLAVFVKYEFWFNLLRRLQSQQIPTILISGLFRSNHIFFKPHGRSLLSVLSGFGHFFVQDAASAAQLKQAGIEQYTIAGDNRIDRVYTIAQHAKPIPVAADFCQSSPVMVVGSSWAEDEAHLLPYFNSGLPDNWKVIIAPHEIDESHIKHIETQLALPHIRYSEADNQPEKIRSARVLIIDNIGMLSALYQYGKIAHIGGGFKTGLHNTLEPIAFGLPVLFGPKYHKFEEARYLVEAGGGFVIEQQGDLAKIMEKLQQEAAYQSASAKALGYIQNNQGATQKILDWITSAGL